MSDLERRMRRLEALEAIRTCIFSYAAAGDRHNDPKVVSRLFAEDGSYEMVGLMHAIGREEVVRQLTEIGETFVLFSFHHPGGPLIELADDGLTARAFWWCWIPVRVSNGDGTSSTRFGAGHYNGQFKEVGGEWKIAKMKFEPKLQAPVEAPWSEIEGEFEWLV